MKCKQFKAGTQKSGQNFPQINTTESNKESRVPKNLANPGFRQKGKNTTQGSWYN